jgi:ParB family chromosome partitioning protein
VSNRLPLLNLPEDIKDSLQTGKIAYTKAIAIARVKDDAARQSLLEEAIEQNLSLDYIRNHVKALRPRSEIKSPKAQIEDTTRRLREAKPWKNPKRWKRVQALLQKLESIIEQEINEDI